MNQQHIKYQDKLNELLFDIPHENNRGITFIFVEGISDIKLFRKLFDDNKCKVEVIPGGKRKVEECVSFFLNKGHQLIIGIRDADFLHLNENQYSKQNMFLTDCHDVEMTMLAQNDTFSKFAIEYPELSLEKREILMKTIEMISYLKWLNEKEGLGLTITEVGFLDLLSFVNFELDFTQYLQRVIARSENPTIEDVNIIREKINELKEGQPDLFQLTNGHDLLNTFALFIKKVTGEALTERILAREFRLIFSFEHFKTTDLYTNLENWSSETGTVLFVNQSND